VKDDVASVIAVVTLYLRGIAPLIAAAATFVQQLQAHCPDAFDEAGQLRPDWQEIAAAKFATAPQLDPTIPTRTIPLHLNRGTEMYDLVVAFADAPDAELHACLLLSNSFSNSLPRVVLPYIKRIYRTLRSRPTQRCTVYCTDRETQEYLAGYVVGG
jgi:hypothetical protein